MHINVRKRNPGDASLLRKIKSTNNEDENMNDKRRDPVTGIQLTTIKQKLLFIPIVIILMILRTVASFELIAVSILLCVIFGLFMAWKRHVLVIKKSDVKEPNDKEEVEDVEEVAESTPSPQSILRENCEILKEGSPSILRLPLDEVVRIDADLIRKCELGKVPPTAVPEKVIMVVGATGAGKTTLINGMINYMLGIKWEDDYRFKMVADPDEERLTNESVSQTQWITAYTLCYQSYFTLPITLTIIDTPGFGDTRGIEQDKTTMNKILKFFSSIGEDGIDHIDAVGLVVQASNPRLTPTQRFIFDSVLSIFGKDIEKNIFLLITFADGQKPPVLSSIEGAKIPFTMSFKFNNSALFASNKACSEEFSFDAMFWKMGMKSFELFFTQLCRTESRTLTLTKNVLEERHMLETYVRGIHMQLHCGLGKLEQLQHECTIVSQHEADIEANKVFTYIVREDKAVQKELPSGQHTTTCLICNFTCHESCDIADDDGKRGCWAMNGDNCRICPEKCFWRQHKNIPYKFVIESVEVEKTSTELEERYKDALGKKTSVVSLINNLLEEFCNVQLEVLYLTDEIRRSLVRLKQIALRPAPLSATDYIDVLIDSEKSEKKPGFSERVKQLQDAKKQAELIFNVENQIDPFEAYRKNKEESLKKSVNGTVTKKVALTIKELPTKLRDAFKKRVFSNRDKRDKLTKIIGSEID